MTTEKTHLQRTFEGLDGEKHGSSWCKLWDEGNDLWDRGLPSPALIDLVERNNDLFNPFTHDGRRKKVLVPGCGRGYDVAMLALHGFEAYGLDISETGVIEAKKYVSAELEKPQDYNFGEFKHPVRENAGPVSFYTADFFSDWNNGLQFDIVYDYTFLCALPPSMRAEWGKRMSELLNPDGGLLICLEFPMYKDPTIQGPPWGLNGVHWDLLALGNDGILHTRTNTTPHNQKNGKFTRVAYIQPERTYKVGEGTDMLSVYTLK